ncbi:phosphoribosyltransferase-like protein [Sphingomonas sp. CFBP 13706]|uniref:phosphoribosyltransferase-like protein n=1 Tax=Sphingomonas sp. CFBP 13706 TaxID=2775314 RepID=UPI001786B0CD|nr:hypothetical protein [Sphingomonas sp. CFBP 13706]MBD8736230.1 hypothetical protein [Sphingomonas sp. CFBP 13706]
MNTLGLRLIADIMGWGEDGTATEEYAWLRLMASAKYDGYSDFRAGSRFIENLATWLKQFDPEDRHTAYDFVRQRLVYISAAEMQRTIEAFVPETVTPHLRRLAAQAAGIAAHEVWGSTEGATAFKRILRRCLFIGLSDGSRIDILRRANATKLSTEQIAPMMNIGIEKWQDLGKELCDAEKDADARFEHVYLIDDFTASGTTFIREVGGKWKGKLTKFNALVEEARREMDGAFPLARGYSLHIHHYLSTYKARRALEERVDDARRNWTERSFGDISITQGVLLPETLPLDAVRDENLIEMCGKYYDDQLYQRLKKHCDEAGQTSMKLGYADCALPIVLEHNTPNNSIPLLWAETEGTLGHRMVPLFRRRDRHG